MVRFTVVIRLPYQSFLKRQHNLGIDPDLNKDGNPRDKYQAISGSKISGTLFNGNSYDADKLGLLTEGEFDAMLAQQELGEHYSVITSGSASMILSHEWRERLQISPLVLSIHDNDLAGQKASERLTEQLGDIHRPVELPIGKDITEFVIEHDGDLVKLVNRNSAWWPDGVPDSWRSLMLTGRYPIISVLAELINRGICQGLLNPNYITIPELIRANKEMSFQMRESTINHGVTWLIGIFLQKLSSELRDSKGVKSCKNSPSKGRHAGVWRTSPLSAIREPLEKRARAVIQERRYPVKGNLPVLANGVDFIVAEVGIQQPDEVELISNIFTEKLAPLHKDQYFQESWAKRQADRDCNALLGGLDSTSSSSFPEGWPLGNANEYRMAYIHGWVEAHPDESRSLPKQKLMYLLGISRGTVRSIMLNAGLKVEEQCESISINSSKQVKHQIDAAAKMLQGYPKHAVIITKNGVTLKRPCRTDADLNNIQKYMVEGATVQVVFQTANAYSAISNTPLSTKQSQHKRLSDRPSKNYVSRKDKKKQTNATVTSQHDLSCHDSDHDPEWIRGQLILILKRSGYKQKRSGQLVHRIDGTVIPANASIKSLAIIVLASEGVTV